MPREVVKPSTPRSDDPFIIKVGWDANGAVQIGVESDEMRSLAWKLWGGAGTHDQSAHTIPLGKAVLDAVSAADEELRQPTPADVQRRNDVVARHVLDAFDTAGCFYGVWADLDRQQINRLIRLLRRARDAAYGADE